MTAEEFISTFNAIRQEYPKSIPKKEIFSLAKEFILMEIPEVIMLLRENNDDLRLGAVSILDWKARSKKTSAKEIEEAYLAYINNHKWINNWGMVDRAAPYVVGGYLFDKSREPLYKLAHSQNPLERRTAIVSTYFFIRKDNINDTFKIAEILVNDPEHFVQTAVGSWVREAGKRDEAKLRKFLDNHAASMPRTTLRNAIETLDKNSRTYFMNLKS